MVVLRELTPGRPIRMEDDLKELGENTLGKLKEAIKQGNRELSLALADYLFLEGKAIHDTYIDWVFADLDWIARNYGEEEIPKVLRHVRGHQLKMMQQLMQHSKSPPVTQLTGVDYVKMYAEFMRGHRSGPDELGDIKVWEGKDCWVMAFDPCGSGGGVARGPRDGSGSRLKPPYNLGKTTKPYPWAWGKVGVPYYCLHCCLWSEIMAIEQTGYPSRITECPADDFSKPCHWYIYKDPNLIPEKYFNRVGFKKDPSRFRRRS